MGLAVITPPANEPISLDEMKDHLKVDGTDQDSYITSLSVMGRQLVEQETTRQLCTATLRYDVESASPWSTWQALYDMQSYRYGGGYDPYTGYTSQGYGLTNQTYQHLQGRIGLPRSPVQAVSLVQFYDANGTLQTLTSGTDYRVYVTDNEQTAFVLLLTIPQIQTNREDAIQITFTAGYSDDETNVPETAKTLIRLMAAEIFTKRSITVDSKLTQSPLYDRLLNSLRPKGYK
jgi:uncharacterized phiE125 gp8 family phage protein